MDKGGYGRGCEIRYKVGKMADNLPLDYSCPHPFLPGRFQPPLLPPPSLPPAYVPSNRCSSFTTNAETLNARAKAYAVLLYLAGSRIVPAFLFLSLAVRQKGAEGDGSMNVRDGENCACTLKHVQIHTWPEVAVAFTYTENCRSAEYSRPRVRRYLNALHTVTCRAAVASSASLCTPLLHPFYLSAPAVFAGAP